MVQTYGVLPPTAGDPGPSTSSEGEQTALLGGDRDTFLKRDAKLDGHATIVSCISNLSNTIIGSGMLTFPMALASAGIIPGILTCIFSGVIGGFGLYLLSLCATYTPHRRSSFFAVARLTFPKAAVFFDLAIAIKCFGVSVSYLIIVKGLMPNVVASIYHVLTSPNTNPPPWSLNGSNWLTLFMIMLVPLAFFRKLDSLRHTSYIALFSVAYLVVIVIRCYFWPLDNMPSQGEIHWVHLTPQFITTFPVQVFAYTCAQNLFPLYNEVKSNTQSRMNVIIGGSIGFAILTYEIIAIFGYLTFGSNVGPNIIAMYPSTSLFIATGQLAIVLLVLFSYPLQVHPCRNSLDKVFHPHRLDEAAKPRATDEGEEEDVRQEGHIHADMTPIKHTLLTSLIIAAGFITAYNVDDLRLVLSFVGSTGSTTISFILPGIFYWKLTRDDPERRALNRAAMGLAIYGAFIFVFCLGFNIYQVLHPSVEV